MRVLTLPTAALAAIAILTAATGNRQVTQNEKSPPAETSITLDNKPVTIEYNAPSLRDPRTAEERKVEGGLIPYDGIYRLGADAATTLTTDTDLMIGDLQVMRGVYTLYLQAQADGPWQLVVNKQTGQWGTEYNRNQDHGRTAMKLTKLPSAVERFKITLFLTDEANGELSVEWGHTQATVPIKQIAIGSPLGKFK